jgi:hypothetical protein
MNLNDPWKRLLERVRIDGQLDPVSDAQLDAFEIANKIKLPHSYREFCKTFGPGSLHGRIWIHIATPTRSTSRKHAIGRSAKVNIDVLNKEVWSTFLIDLDEYCDNPGLIRNGLFFGRDIYTHHYFWNKAESTDRKTNEMAIYVIYREMKIHRLADSFESFIYDICLDRGIPNHGKLDEDPPVFEAAHDP